MFSHAKGGKERYQVRRLLGAGGMGKVYLAQDLQRGEAVALKFLSLTGEAAAFQFFHDEVKTLSHLSHPHLVKIFDYYEAPEKIIGHDKATVLPTGPCFAMEYVPGRPLHEFPRQENTVAWLDLTAQMAQGLQYLHNRNILHRDLKPSNVLLGSKSQVKILDFGLATTGTRMAKSSGLGTLAYAAPEVFWGEYTVQSDLFSLGVLLFECLTGRMPFEKPFSIRGATAHPAPKLKKLRPDLSEFFCDAVDRLLELIPARRPSSALSLLRFFNQHVDTPYPLQEEEGTAAILQKIPLVGRETELKKIRQGLPSSHSPRQPTVLGLTGPTGVGRSRLLEELKWEIQLQGGHFQNVEPAEAETWLPLLLQRDGPPPSVHSDFVSLTRRLLDSLAGKSLVLAFLDLHQWSETSLKNLRVFLKFAQGRFLKWTLILEWNSDLGIPSLFEEIGDTVELKDLNLVQTQHLIEQATLETPLPPTIKQAIAGDSGGRPLLILEAVRQALSGKSLDAGESALLQSLPKSLQEASLFRIRQLSSPARQLLALISVHPEPFALSTGQEIFAKSSDDFEEALLELDAKGFTLNRHAGQPLLGLGQPSLRSSYAKAMDAEETLFAHGQWTQRLLQEGGSTPQEIPLALPLAAHALQTGQADIAVPWGLSAAELLIKQGKISEAVQLYQRLGALARHAEDRYVLQGSAAPLLYRLGRFEEALQAYDLWFKDRPDDKTFLQKCKHCFFTGQVLFAEGREREARERFETCLKIGDSRRHPTHRLYHARSHSFLAALDEKKGQFETAQGHLGVALKIAAGEPMLLGEVEQRMGEVAQASLNFEDALEHFKNSFSYFLQAEQIQAQALALQLIAMLHWRCGRLSSALEGLNQAVELSQKIGQVLQTARFEENRALVFMDLGEYGKAAEDMSRAQEVLEILGSREERALIEIHRAQFHVLVGNLERAEKKFSSLEKQKEMLGSMGLWTSVLQLRAEAALLYFQFGEAEQGFKNLWRACSQDSKKYRAFTAQIGLCRALAGQGRLTEQEPALLQSLIQLVSLGGPRFVIWKATLAPLSRGLDQTPEESEVLELLNLFEKNQLPEQCLEALALLTLDFKRRGLENTSMALRQRYGSHLEMIFKQLPEELKMDFQKYRNSQSLDQALSEKIARPAGESPAPLVTPTSSPGGNSPKISEMRFRQYSEISRQISQKHDLSEVLERVMDAAIELTGAERGFLLLKNEHSKTKPLEGFEVKTARGLSHKALQQQDFQLSMTAVKQAVEMGSSLLTGDAMLDPRLQEKNSVMQFQLKSILVVPMELEGEITGAIYLDHRYNPGCFSEEDVVFLTAFVAQAALAIQKAQLFAEIQKAKQKLELQVNDQAQHIEKISGELAQVRDQLKYGYEEMVGQSPAMMQVFQMLDHVTDTAIPVWIHGESGTGKELVARSLHYNSPRKAGPFVSENCSAIPETLLESELFGHKKGAFTHADRDRVGLFEQADKGTLFLDEVADMSMNMQAKLLRVLQEGEVRPLGSGKKIKVDVRLVTASNKDLEKMVNEEKFRADLFFRMNGLTIRLPPLRERIEDIPLLVDYLLRKIARDYKLPSSELSDEALQRLLHHSWPGNIRELEGVIRNALLFAKGRPVGPEYLSLGKGWRPVSPAPAPLASSVSSSTPGDSGSEGEKSEEKNLVLEALKKCRLNKRLAAKEMGVSLRSFYMRMDRHGIPKNKPVLAKYLGIKG